MGSTRVGVMQTFFQTKEAQEMRECTFKPYVSENSRKMSNNRRLLPDEACEEITDKCAELFEHAKHVISVKQACKDKTTEEVEFERSKEECTFKPTIHGAPPLPRPSKTKENAPFARQHFDRMSKAREERERVREITERGYSSTTRGESGPRPMHFSSVGDRSSTRKESSVKRPGSILCPSKKKSLNADLRIPLLLVDIGIGDRKERIAVYEGDRADTLARDFCIRHGND